MKKIISVLFISILMLTLMQPTTTQAAIKINKKSITIEVGETYNLKVTGTEASIKWYSSDVDIATVSKNGKVKGISIGKATIKAKVKNKTYSCSVRVWPEDKNITLYEDDYLRLAYFNIVDGRIYFTVTNRTDELFTLADTYLILDKTTYKSSLYCVDVPPNYTEMYVYETESDIENIDKISGSFYIFDKDGLTIEEFKFKDININ